jgi:hypothetical protein
MVLELTDHETWYTMNNQIKVHRTDNLKTDKDGGLTVGLRFSDVKFNIPIYQVTENGKYLSNDLQRK